MAYVDPNYKTKKELKAAVEAGKLLAPYNPSGMFPEKQNGETTIEGPHYPEAHRWYARVEVKDGYITKVIS